MRVVEWSDFESRTRKESIARLLAFAGLLQMAHEFIKAEVLDRPKGFFGGVKKDDGTWEWLYEDEGKAWRENVRAKDKTEFRASLAWLHEMSALTVEQYEALGRVKKHRDDLTHDLALFLFHDEYKEDPRILMSAIEVFHALDRFWIDVELDSGMAAHLEGVIEPEDVTSMTAMTLGLAVNSFIEVFLDGDDADASSAESTTD